MTGFVYYRGQLASDWRQRRTLWVERAVYYRGVAGPGRQGQGAWRRIPVRDAQARRPAIGERLAGKLRQLGQLVGREIGGWIKRIGSRARQSAADAREARHA